MKWSGGHGYPPTWTNTPYTPDANNQEYQAGIYDADNASGANVTINKGGSLWSIYGGYSDYNNSTATNLPVTATNNTVTMKNGGKANEIYGGSNENNGTTHGNTVTITGGEAQFVYGGESSHGAATGNTVTMTGGKADRVYGGMTSTGAVTGNTMTMTTGGEARFVYGGYSQTGTATDNTVTMSGGTVVHDVDGGYSVNGAVTGNTVIMTGGQAVYVSGGYSVDGAVTGNAVTLSGSGQADSVSGGYTYDGSATNNTVTISGGTVANNVYGGYIRDGAATKNTVTMTGGEAYKIYGGYSWDGAATGNAVTLSGSGQADEIYGGYSESSDDATGNTVIMTGGTVTQNVYGGMSVDKAAEKNTVSMTGGTVTDTVYGGFGYEAATGNTVIMTGGQADSVVGGYSWDGAATGNTVEYSGGKITGSLYGGQGDTSTDNTFISIGSREVGGNVGYFQNYQFVLDADQNVGLTVGQTFTMDPTTNNILGVDALGGGTNIMAGDTLTLVSAGSIDDDNGNRVITAGATGTGQKGASLLFDYQVAVNAKTITATVTKVRAHPQTKSVLEGRIAGITTINQAGDMLAGKGIAAASAVTESTGFGIYAATSGGTNRYKTGSHVDLDSISFMLGAGWRKNTGVGALLFSPFFEFGWGKYKAHNDFSGFADVNAKGNTNYQGGGLLARYDHCNGVYGEGSFRLGRLHQSYNSSDLTDGAGRSSHYKYNQLYTSLHLGIGRKFTLGMGELDVYGKYFWTRTGKKDVTIMDDPISFDATHSHRMRLGARYTHAVSEAVKPYAGAGFEYEFAGKAKGKAYRLYDINSPRIKGGSGLLEAGIDYAPCGKKWALNAGATGFVGKRRGIMGQLGIRADF